MIQWLKNIYHGITGKNKQITNPNTRISLSPEQNLILIESEIELRIKEEQPDNPEEAQTPMRDYVRLKRELNEEMRCGIGKNQAYILSRLKTQGRIKKVAPQVCLDCKIRNFLGWRKRVYADYIKMVCCGDYEHTCEAYIMFMSRRLPFIQP